MDISCTMPETKALSDALHGAGLYTRYDSNHGNDATACAERNLDGRTHYVSASTRRFHKSRISKAMAFSDGLIFGIVESCSANYENTRRVHRPVFFDLEGHIIARPLLEDSPKSGATALKLFYRMAADIEPLAVTRAMLERRIKAARRDVETLESICAAI